jgi:monovalent cation/proton antiporter MnhG/PhaG subunit
VSEVLLAIGVAAQLACCLGVLVMRSVFDRLHYAAAGTTVGPILVGAALVVEESVSSAGIAAIVTVSFLVVLGPAVTIATAHAAHELDERRDAGR